MRLAPMYRWILCSFIALSMILTGIPVWAEELGVVTGSTVNVRTGPGTSNAVLTQVSKGESYTVLAKTDGWAKIRLNNGKEGWIKSSLLNIQQSSDKKVIAKDNGINLRKGPGTSYAVVSKVQAGAVLTVLEAKNGWYKVKTIAGVQAWIAGWLVTDQTNSVPAPDGGGSSTADKTVLITGKIVNVRSGPGTGYGIVTKISLNEKHSLLAEQNGWYKIQVGNKQGWVSSTLAKITPTAPVTPPAQTPSAPTPTPTPEPVSQSSLIVTGDVVNIRSAGNLEAQVLGKVSRGTRLPVLAKAGDWYQVQLNSGSYGWIAGWLTETTSSSTPSRGSGTEVLSAPLAEGKNFRILDVAGRPTLVLEGWQQDQYEVRVHKETKTLTLEIKGRTQVNYDGSLTRLGIQSLKIAPQGDKALVTLAFAYPPLESITFDADKATSYISIGVESSRGLAGKLIVVDPGHSGVQSGWLDPGAIGPLTKLQERDVTLGISLKLKTLLENAGARVIMTHSNTTNLSLAERAVVANNNGAAIFVSIHANSSVNKSLSGHSTYFYAPVGDEFLGSQRYSRQKLANLVQREMVKAAGRNDMGVMEENFAVLRETRVPSILVETAFLSDRQEEILLGQDAFRQQLAEGIFRGIQAYFE